MMLALLSLVAGVIPGLAVAVRRLHDQNKPGILLLLGLIPGIGGLILLFFMLMEGDGQENDFGPDPRDREAMRRISDVFE